MKDLYAIWISKNNNLQLLYIGKVEKQSRRHVKHNCEIN